MKKKNHLFNGAFRGTFLTATPAATFEFHLITRETIFLSRASSVAPKNGNALIFPDKLLQLLRCNTVCTGVGVVMEKNHALCNV